MHSTLHDSWETEYISREQTNGTRGVLGMWDWCVDHRRLQCNLSYLAMVETGCKKEMDSFGGGLKSDVSFRCADLFIVTEY